MDMLGGDKFQKSQTTMGPAKATLLHTSPRRLSQCVRVDDFVNHYGARLDSLGEAFTARDVFGPDARGQTVDTVIRQSQGLLVGFENHDWQHGTEGFFSHYFHAVIDVGKHRWLVK